MKRVIFILALLTYALTLNTAQTQPQMPRLLNYQGTLVIQNQEPVPNGDYKITFKLYDESNNVIWTEVHDPVPVHRGMFHVLLGTNTPLSMPFNEQYELGIQVNNDPELLPHLPLTGAAYAMRADDSDKLLGFSVRSTPTPNMLLPLDNNGKFPISVLPEIGGGSGNYLKKDEPDNSTATAANPILTISNLGAGAGIKGSSDTGYGVNALSEKDHGVWARSKGSGAEVSGVYGISKDGRGVSGRSTNYIGVAAHSNAASHAALLADNQGGGTAIHAYTTGDVAAVFIGNVQVRKQNNQVLVELGEGLDYAEGFDVSDKQEIGPGTILIIDEKNPGKLTKSKNPYDTKVAGIVAGAKGLGSGVRLGPDLFDFDVALAGRVYCNVDGRFGEISPGDLLTTSLTPGYAMKVKDYKKAQGAIIGKAMEGMKKGAKGQILVLVTLQ